MKSNDAFVLGHRHFYNETIWRHIWIEHPNLWLKDVDGTLRLDKLCYVLTPNIIKELNQLNIPLSFALKHMFNIATDFGAFMTCLKGKDIKDYKDQNFGEPEEYVLYSINGPFEKLLR